MEYKKIIDEDSVNVINEQIKRIRAGQNFPKFHKKIRKLITDSLSIKLNVGFSDIFASSRLVKVKFFCSKFNSDAKMKYEIDYIARKLLKEYVIKQIVYLEEDETMLIIWL